MFEVQTNVKISDERNIAIKFETKENKPFN